MANNQNCPEPPRGRGRPRVAEPRTTLCTRIDTPHYDKLVRMALQERKSVSELVRTLLVVHLR